MIVTVACFIRRRWSGFPCKDLALLFNFFLIAVRVAEELGQSAIEQQFKVDKRKVGRRKIATSPMG